MRENLALASRYKVSSGPRRKVRGEQVTMGLR